MKGDLRLIHKNLLFSFRSLEHVSAIYVVQTKLLICPVLVPAPTVNLDGKCARPDCTASDDSDDIFFVERIIGRRTKVEGGVGKKYMWLVKWLK